MTKCLTRSRPNGFAVALPCPFTYLDPPMSAPLDQSVRLRRLRATAGIRAMLGETAFNGVRPDCTATLMRFAQLARVWIPRLRPDGIADVAAVVRDPRQRQTDGTWNPRLYREQFPAQRLFTTHGLGAGAGAGACGAGAATGAGAGAAVGSATGAVGAGLRASGSSRSNEFVDGATVAGGV